MTHRTSVALPALTFDRIGWAGCRFVLSPPLTLHPRADEDSAGLLLLADPELGIDVFARTPEQLSEEWAEQLCFQWDAYALERPENLGPGARRLRDALQARMREEPVAQEPENR